MRQEGSVRRCVVLRGHTPAVSRSAAFHRRRPAGHCQIARRRILLRDAVQLRALDTRGHQRVQPGQAVPRHPFQQLRLEQFLAQRQSGLATAQGRQRWRRPLAQAPRQPSTLALHTTSLQPSCCKEDWTPQSDAQTSGYHTDTGRTSLYSALAPAGGRLARFVRCALHQLAHTRAHSAAIDR